MSVNSCVSTLNGAQYLYVNGKPVVSMAYITYKRDNARYKDFAEVGYKLYSVSLFFGSNYLSDISHLEFFSKGIYDREKPDYEGFDSDVENILRVCPDAMILPRVNVTPSFMWEKLHEEELCDEGTDEFPDNKRPCISSDIWAEEVKKRLREFVAHIESMPYRDSIIGYQIAGGNTEEWIPNDMKGFIGKRSREKFSERVSEGRYRDTEEDYYRFLSEINASRICEFASEIKKLTDRRLVVGSFYGYTLELCERRFAHHALRILLECEDIDFLCSPLSYSSGRNLGTDHSYMVPAHSVKLHNKLYFAENDVRTHLTRPVNDDPRYNAPIWFGPPEEKSVDILKMHHARNLLNGHGGWWFDMWGGWYATESYMSFMQKARALSENCIGEYMNSVSEVAVFIDENSYAKTASGEGNICGAVRGSLGLIGTPYDVYLSSDFEAVKDRYKAYISIVPVNTPLSERIKEYADEKGIPICCVTKENFSETPEYFRSFCDNAGVFIYCEKDSVVFANDGFVFIHTAEDGEYALNLSNLYDAYSKEKVDSKFYAEKGKSYLFMKGRIFGDDQNS